MCRDCNSTDQRNGCTLSLDTFVNRPLQIITQWRDGHLLEELLVLLCQQDRIVNSGNMCDRELDQPLLSPRWCHRAFDVSTFLSLVSVETDISNTARTNTSNSCICHHGKDGCNVDRVHGFHITSHHSPCSLQSQRWHRFLYVGADSHNHESYAECK